MSDNKKEFFLTDDVINHSTATWDLFLNRFDITWAIDNHPKELTITPVETAGGRTIHDDGSIKYKYNNEWFRSDDFTRDHDEKFHVLFGGCSETEGIASPLEEVWSKMLHTELSQTHDVGKFFSIARAGYGWQKIIINFMIYVERYGFPTHFFVLLPNNGRVFKWKKDSNAWFYVQNFPFRGPMPKKDESFFHMNTTAEDHKKFFMDFAIGWKMFEKYCESNGVKLLCSTWDSPDGLNIRKMNFLKSFFYIDDDGFEDFIKEKRSNGKLLDGDLRRRDGHSGKLQHDYWLQQFQNEIERRGLFND